MATKMRFGVQTVQQNVEWSQLIEFWDFLERETHVESIWTMDHLVPPAEGSDPAEPCFEGWMTLAAAAQATSRLRLGCLVTSNTFRHPALLAKMAATLDHISNGRLELGLGAGWHEGEHRAFGIPLGSMRERQDRLEEAAALLQTIFTAEQPINFRGDHYQLDNASFSPGFVQKPHPPLMIGGGGEKRTLRTVARYADVANVLGPVSEVAHKLEVLRSHCAAVGRDFDSIEKTVHVPLFVHENPEVVTGVAEFLAEHLGLSAGQVLEETPVGSASRVREIVSRYADLGVTAIIFPVPTPYDFDAFRHFSDSVVAAFDGVRA
jgi:F420-dependent oxidoreductase-like protein